jgi:hypothetical protein
VDEFQSGTLALIAALPAGTGVFSATCLAHCLSGQPTYTSFRVLGQTMSEVLNDWYFGSGATPVQVVSPCAGWACTGECGVDSATGQPCNGGAPLCEPLRMATEGGSESSDGGVPPAPGWPPTPPQAPPKPPTPPAPPDATEMLEEGVQPSEASLTPAQRIALRQAQCAAAAAASQVLSQQQQATDATEATATQLAGQAALTACLAEAVDTTA